MWHGLTDVLKLRTARRPSQGPANTSCFLPGHPARRRTASSLPTGSSPRSVPGLSSDLGDSVLCLGGCCEPTTQGEELGPLFVAWVWTGCTGRAVEVRDGSLLPVREGHPMFSVQETDLHVSSVAPLTPPSTHSCHDST